MEFTGDEAAMVFCLVADLDEADYTPRYQALILKCKALKADGYTTMYIHRQMEDE